MSVPSAWLLDTNILLRMSRATIRTIPRSALRSSRFASQDARLCFTSQVLGEFWNASTRLTDRNGLGLSIHETDRIARVIEQEFELQPENRDVHDRWRQLLLAHEVRGVQVHDARLAASMYVHQVSQLLTINIRDLRRIPRLRAVHPSEVVHSPEKM